MNMPRVIAGGDSFVAILGGDTTTILLLLNPIRGEQVLCPDGEF